LVAESALDRFAGWCDDAPLVAGVIAIVLSSEQRWAMLVQQPPEKGSRKNASARRSEQRSEAREFAERHH
jgi:hypothetical protein